MTTALVAVIPSHLRLSVVALRRHAALVRALLEELDRVAPLAGASTEAEVVGEQLVEELTHLGRKILECAATMTQTPEIPADRQRHPFARRRAPASSSRFKAASPIPATE
jgi:hypothetical protein